MQYLRENRVDTLFWEKNQPSTVVNAKKNAMRQTISHIQYCSSIGMAEWRWKRHVNLAENKLNSIVYNEEGESKTKVTNREMWNETQRRPAPKHERKKNEETYIEMNLIRYLVHRRNMKTRVHNAINFHGILEFIYAKWARARAFSAVYRFVERQFQFQLQLLLHEDVICSGLLFVSFRLFSSISLRLRIFPLSSLVQLHRSRIVPCQTESLETTKNH